MADCILWLSGGSLLQTRTNHYIMRREYFWGDIFETQHWCCLCGVYMCCLCFCGFPAGDPVCSHSPDTCRWTQNSSVSIGMRVFLLGTLNRKIDGWQKQKHTVIACAFIYMFINAKSNILYQLYWWTLFLIWFISLFCLGSWKLLQSLFNSSRNKILLLPWYSITLLYHNC